METIITKLNQAAAYFFAGVYSLVAWMGPLGSLATISCLVGVLMLWLYGKVSDQAAIRKLKNRISANLIAVRLFNQNLGVVLRLLFRILRDAIFCMRYSLVPMLYMMIPLLLILVQMNLVYGRRGIHPGEAVVVKATVADSSLLGESSGIRLQSGKGYTVETPGVRIPSQNEIAWRIRGTEAGMFHLSIQHGNFTVEKSLNVNTPGCSVSPKRTGENAWELLLNPSEPPIDPATGIVSVEINYPPLEISFRGWRINWLICFFVLSTFFGYCMKDRLKVYI